MSSLATTRPSIAAVILTKNESQHIRRCIESIRADCDRIIVVDSGSTDDTVAIAAALGAEVHFNGWVNHAVQFNHGLSLVPAEIDWVLRIDADETLSDGWAGEFSALRAHQPDIKGVAFQRFICFRGTLIRWGGCVTWQLRLFDRRAGKCEARWMDEHIVVDGSVGQLSVPLIDENLNSLTWWTNKHNAYASREAVELLNLEYNFMRREGGSNFKGVQQAGIKRWLKEKVYVILPSGSRSLMYFLYRYIMRLGFLDGADGLKFHILQGLWYRYLVDLKVNEVKSHIKKNNCDPVYSIRSVLGIDFLLAEGM